MAKILLVEDDNNLREIYEARLQAEGYSIVSAHDGEEALVIAKAEKPDLIISDVMMPKISGFEMLDILRNTDTLKDVKIIMLTALGQNDDQERADKLGADRYLVKSQVTLEDIVNVANELIKGSQPDADSATPTPTPASPAPTATTPPAPATTDTPQPAANEPAVSQPDPVPPPSTPEPPAISSIPVSTPPPDTTSAAPSLAEPADEEQQEVKSQIDSFLSSTPTVLANQSAPLSTPPAGNTQLVSPQPDSGEPMLTPEDTNTDSDSRISSQPAGKKVIEPLPDSENKPNINELLAEESAKEIVENKAAEDDTAPPTMSAADMAPTPAQPVISPDSSSPVKDSVDPNSIAL
ncbi:MAG TPA: response regulator [Candidatus Saccharimonadales bacterium]|jgi:CheY-like chemotaxis protein